MDTPESRQQTPPTSSPWPLATVTNPPARTPSNANTASASPLWDSELGELSPAGPLIKTDRRPLKRLRRKSASIGLGHGQTPVPLLEAHPRAAASPSRPQSLASPVVAFTPQHVEARTLTRHRPSVTSSPTRRPPSSGSPVPGASPPPREAFRAHKRTVSRVDQAATAMATPFTPSSLRHSNFVIAESPWSSSPVSTPMPRRSALAQSLLRHSQRPASPPLAESAAEHDRFSASIYSVSPRASMDSVQRRPSLGRLRRSSDSEVELSLPGRKSLDLTPDLASLSRPDSGLARDAARRSNTPQRALFQDLPSAHSSITAGSQGRHRRLSSTTIEPYKIHLPDSCEATPSATASLNLQAVLDHQDSADLLPSSPPRPTPLTDAFFGSPFSSSHKALAASTGRAEQEFGPPLAGQLNPDYGTSPRAVDASDEHQPRFRVTLEDPPMDQDFDDFIAAAPPCHEQSHFRMLQKESELVDGKSEGSSDPAGRSSRESERNASDSPGLNTFDFGLVPSQPFNASGTARRNLDSSASSRLRKNGPPSPAGLPPDRPLPPSPPPPSPRPAFVFSRHNSAVVGLSNDPSYGDTRILLDLHRQDSSPARSRHDSLLSAAAPPEPTAAPGSCSADPTSPRHRHRTALESRKGFHGQPRKAGEDAREVPTFRVARPVTPQRQVERITRNLTTAASIAAARDLDAEIETEMKRFEGVRPGLQRTSSVVVYNENGIEYDYEHDLGPGGLQSLSSRDFSGHLGSMVSDDSGHGASDRGSSPDETRWSSVLGPAGRAMITAKGSFAASLPSTRASGSDAGSIRARDDEDNDWETIDDGRVSRADGRGEIIHEASGSSLADFSSRASLGYDSPDGSPVQQTRRLPVHSPDGRIQPLSQARQITPEDAPVLRPSQRRLGQSASSRRDGLSRSSATYLPTPKTYRHPLPLFHDHVHPFKSSPPVVMSSAKSMARQRSLSDGPSPAFGPAMAGPAALGHDGSAIRLYRPFSATSSDEHGPSHPLRHGHHVSAVDDPTGTSASSIWMDTFALSINDLGESQVVPGANGSFAKVTTLGPKANITGTPQGTGMRQVGSSLADASSPGIIWSSSSPGYPANLPGDEIDRLSAPPPAAHPAWSAKKDGGPAGQAEQQAGVMYEQIRAHRDLLAAEGLLPAAYAVEHDRPVSRRGGARPVSFLSLRSSLPHESIAAGGRRPTDAPSSEPFCINPTPALPPPRDSEKFIGFDYHLYRQSREDSTSHESLVKRKRNLSRAVLALCFLFPPLLLLYGYGMLDGMIASLTSGDLNSFGQREKRIALIVGWSLAAGAVIGIVVGMIIVGLGK